MALETFPQQPRPSLLDRAFDLSRVNLEVIAYTIIVTLSIIAHLWNLGAMAMHHDESIHAWMSWKFYTGNGDFTCAGHDPANGIERVSQTYCYDPVYHGPSLYMFTLVSYFLFGAGDAQARLPMALAGIALVASAWMLRPYIGRRGALIATVLLAFSPSLLYFTRFARHDGLMVLWEFWLFIGFLRYLDTGKAAYLYLVAASLALALATHELYYIVFFIFGVLLFTRIIAETALARFLNPAFAIVLGLAAVFIAINPPLPVGEGLYLGEKMALVAATVLLTWLASRVWTPQPVLIPRFKALWQHERNTLWVALALLFGLYVVMYTTFFAYPPGIFGPVQGLSYWLGSQQDFARGDQPWYYYLMQLGIYEPLSILTGIGAAIYLFSRRAPGKQSAAAEESADEHNAAAVSSSNGQEHDEADAPQAAGRKGKRKRKQAEPESTPVTGETIHLAPQAAASTPTPHSAALPTGNLFQLILVVWFFSAIIIFSWAGEKMPWLTVHMSLPGNLLAAWVLAELLRVLPPLRTSAAQQAQDAESSEHDHADDAHPPQAAPGWRTLLVPPTLLLMLITLGVASWRLLLTGGEGQAAQASLLQGLIPLVIFGALLYALLTLGQQIGTRAVLAASALTLSVLLGMYMIRASWLAVYTHPDVPVELLVYTQTSPDVPRYVEYVQELAINQTRNHRSAEDVAGGLTMPLVVSSGEHSLAWPVQWYLRDFQRIAWKDESEMDDADLQTFEVELPNGEMGFAPVLMLAGPHVTPELREQLREHYVQPYGEQGVFNWWFPEGDKCSPDSPGYKRFYFNSVTSFQAVAEPPPDGCVADNLDEAQATERLDTLRSQIHAPWTPLIWPFLPQNQEKMLNYMLFRELPDPLRPGSRDMEVWVRADLVSGGATAATGTAGSTSAVNLLAQQTIGQGDLSSPTGIVIADDGTIYVTDTSNHRIHVFDSDGDLEDTIGEYGQGEGQFNEPRGLALDDDGNLYVADTWNARIVKLDSDGEWLDTWGEGEPMGEGDPRLAGVIGPNEADPDADPLRLFGPRGVAVDEDGQVYIADTGNRRIVITDDEGEYIGQWGTEGSRQGAFNEPADVAVGANGLIYVADIWNGRVQVFQTDGEGNVAPLPLTVWRVNGWNANTYDDPALAVSSSGRVYVSVPARSQVAASGPLGETILRWSGSNDAMTEMSAPSGIAVGPDGGVYVVDRTLGQVFRFDVPDITLTEPDAAAE